MSHRPNQNVFEAETSTHSVEIHRQKVLEIIQERDEPLTVASLAEEVVTDKRREPTTPEHIDSVRLRLHHVDLPTLDAAGHLEYDHHRRVIWLVDD